MLLSQNQHFKKLYVDPTPQLDFRALANDLIFQAIIFIATGGHFFFGIITSFVPKAVCMIKNMYFCNVVIIVL